MTFGTRAAAAELARLLDAATTTPLPAGTSGSPAQLAGVALRLQAVAPALAATAAPRPEYRAALRQRLLAVAAVQAPAPARAAVRSAALEAAVTWSQGVRARRGVGVAVGAMASVVVVAGIGTAGTQSLPGDPFYGVKKTGESLELRAAGSTAEKGTTHLEHASRRLDEVSRLTRGRASSVTASGTGPVAGSSTSQLVVETLAAMDDATRDGSRLLVRAAAAQDDPALLETLTSFSVRQDRALTALVPELPLAARERAAESLALVEEVGEDALTLLLDELPAPSLPAPLDVPATTAVPEVPGAPAPAPAPEDAAPAASEPATPSPAPAPSPDAPDSTTDSPEPAPAPTSSPTPSPRPQPRPTLEVPLPTLPGPVPLPTSVPVPVPVPSVPALPVPVPVPTTLPSLPAVPGVPSLPGLLVEGPRPTPSAPAAPQPTPAPPVAPAS